MYKEAAFWPQDTKEQIEWKKCGVGWYNGNVRTHYIFFPWCVVSIFRRSLCFYKVRNKSYYILVDVDGALDLTQFSLTAKCLYITIVAATKWMNVYIIVDIYMPCKSTIQWVEQFFSSQADTLSLTLSFSLPLSVHLILMCFVVWVSGFFSLQNGSFI